MSAAQSTISRMVMAMMSAAYVQYASGLANAPETLNEAYSPAISSTPHLNGSEYIIFQRYLLLRAGDAGRF
jgi:hypothetical protein